MCYTIRYNCESVEDYPFRTFDGSCNNLEAGREHFGSTERAMKRRVPADYADGKHVFPYGYI